MDTIKIIKECSGLAGVTNYQNMPLDKFVEWFENNISYNDIESQEEGKKLIKYLIENSK
jgi:hypothetical protein